MLLKDLKERNSLILLSENRYNYNLYPLTKQECEQIIQILNEETDNDCDFILNPNIEVNMCGSLKETFPSQLKDLIFKHKTHKIKDFREKGKVDIEIVEEYPCYQPCGTKSKTNNVIVHEDALSSFKCACEKIQSEYFIILKEEMKIDLIRLEVSSSLKDTIENLKDKMMDIVGIPKELINGSNS